MIGLDTNVLMRAVAIDEVEQTERARKLIARECAAGDRGFVNSVVLAETAWALQTVYGFGKTDIVRVIDDLLAVPQLVVEHAAAARLALGTFERHPISFADALIGEVNRAAGCSVTATFDRRAARLAGFRRVP